MCYGGIAHAKYELVAKIGDASRSWLGENENTAVQSRFVPNGGRTIKSYHRNEFSQGDPADTVFYIQEGKVKVCVVSDSGKEAVVALHGKGASLARDA
jgi:CRP-like cAMP-binding protein